MEKIHGHRSEYEFTDKIEEERAFNIYNKWNADSISSENDPNSDNSGDSDADSTSSGISPYVATDSTNPATSTTPLLPGSSTSMYIILIMHQTN